MPRNIYMPTHSAPLKGIYNASSASPLSLPRTIVSRPSLSPTDKGRSGNTLSTQTSPKNCRLILSEFNILAARTNSRRISSRPCLFTVRATLCVISNGSSMAIKYRDLMVWDCDPVDSARVVQPLDSFVMIPEGERIEMTLFLKCHSKAK